MDEINHYIFRCTFAHEADEEPGKGSSGKCIEVTELPVKHIYAYIYTTLAICSKYGISQCILFSYCRTFIIIIIIYSSLLKFY